MEKCVSYMQIWRESAHRTPLFGLSVDFFTASTDMNNFLYIRQPVVLYRHVVLTVMDGKLSDHVLKITSRSIPKYGRDIIGTLY
jgi:hypothetical protein